MLSHGRVYAAANVIHRAAGLVLIPVYAQMLVPADFGVYAIVQSVIEVAAILAGMGFTGAMNRFFLEYPDDAAMRGRVVSTALLAIGAVGLLLALLSPGLAWLATWLLLGSDVHAPLFVVAFIGLVATVLFEIGASYLVVRKRSWEFLALSVAKAVTLIGSNLVCVVWLEMGVLGILLANAGTMALLALTHGALILRKVGVEFSPDLARQLLRFGLPLVPSALAHAALPLVERYFLNLLAGASAVGLYALASRLTALLQMFVAVPFSQTFAVRRVETLVQGVDQAPFNRALLLFVWLMSGAALLLSALAVDLLALIASPAYAAAAVVVPLLGLCQVLAAINFNLELGLHFTKQTHLLPLISLVALALSVPANALLVGPWGVTGSALALLAANLGRLAATWQLNRRFGTRQIRLDWPRAAGILAFTTGAGLAFVHGLPPALDWVSIVGKVALSIALVLLLVWTPLLDAATRRDLLSALKWRR